MSSAAVEGLSGALGASISLLLTYPLQTVRSSAIDGQRGEQHQTSVSADGDHRSHLHTIEHLCAYITLVMIVCSHVETELYRSARGRPPNARANKMMSKERTHIRRW